MEVEEPEWKVIYKEVEGYRIKTNQEWGEVCFVPGKMGYSKKSPVYRYLVASHLKLADDGQSDHAEEPS